MRVYRLKISLKKTPEVYRVVAIDASSSLLKLHHVILKSVNFEEGELASFYLVNKERRERQEFCLSEMQKEKNARLMAETKLSDVLVNDGDSLVYIYDFLNMWTFDVELESADFAMKFTDKLPEIIESEGENPVQELFVDFDEENMVAEDFDLFKDLMDMNDGEFGSDDDDDDFKMDSFDDFASDFEEDEISGFGSLDELEGEYSDEDPY